MVEKRELIVAVAPSKLAATFCPVAEMAITSTKFIDDAVVAPITSLYGCAASGDTDAEGV